MNIGLIVGRFPPDWIGGAELQCQQLARELARHGHNVTVFTRRYNHRPNRQRKDGYLIRRRNVLPVPGLRMIWDIFPSVWQIARHRPRPDVILCYQTLNSGLIGMIAQAILGIPMVLSVRGNREYRPNKSRLINLIVPPIFKHARRIFIQSASIRKDMYEQLRLAGKQGLYERISDKIVVIPNGINLQNFERCKGGKIVFVGRLVERKGVSDLIVGMRKLPKYDLLIIGDGPDRRRLEAMASEMSVTFTGEIMSHKVLDYYKKARVLVLPSHLGDGFPNVIMEAMACGIPVVATRIAGIPDLVQDGETGFLFEPGDIQQMVSYIDRLMKDDQLWSHQGKRSVERVMAYSWRNVIPQIEQLLSDVIDLSEEKKVVRN